MKKPCCISLLISFISFSIFLSFSGTILAQEKDTVCAVYFTGIGCPHCAQAEPVIEKLLEEHSNLVLIKYEIYQKQENALLLSEYNDNFGSGLGIPLLIFGKNEFLVGDNSIAKGAPLALADKDYNLCPLPNGEMVDSSELDFNSLPGSPEILNADQGEVAGVRKEGSCQDLTLTKILSLGAADSVNPCSIAVLTAMLLAME